MSIDPSERRHGLARTAGALALLAMSIVALGAESPGPTPVALPDFGASLLRVLGAMALVLGLLFGGAWIMRHWRRLSRRSGQPAALEVLEVRSLGNRQALYVIGYQEQRFLVAASPAGVNLVTVLPPGPAVATIAAPAPTSFRMALEQVLAPR